MKVTLGLLIIMSAFGFQAFAEVPVTPHPMQKQLLQSADANLARNKRVVYDFFRVILRGWRLDRVNQFLAEGYIQHNPNVKTGRRGFVDFFQKISQGRIRDIPESLVGLVSIQAEGDFVTFSFVRNLVDGNGTPYTTTWFDMFRVTEGVIVEHWDNAEK